MDELIKSLIGQAPLVAGVLIAVAAFARGWIHGSAEFDRIAAQRDRLEELLYETVGIAKHATRVAEFVHENGNGKTTRRKPKPARRR